MITYYHFHLQDGSKNEREVDNSDDAASANQKRMNADPLEVMLMNMGYRITGVLDGEEEEEQGGPVTCRPSWEGVCQYSTKLGLMESWG